MEGKVGFGVGENFGDVKVRGGVVADSTMVPVVSWADERRSWCGGGGAFVARKGRILMMDR